jgi:hypothetical protein
MFYTIYKTTNIVNGKFYIGKHQTKDLNDGYLGSGKLIRRAIKKYGMHNFHKEILFECCSEKHMNTLEKILVVPDSELNYNLCPGGKGGFGFLNEQEEKLTWVRKGRITTNRLLNERKSEKAKTKYYNNVKLCIKCHSPLSYEKRRNNYCNHSCATSLVNTTRVINKQDQKGLILT